MRPRVSRVHRILQNPFYVGRFEWRGEIWPGKHEAIFTEAEWQALQHTFGDATPSQTRHEDGALTGFLVCAECGCRMTWDPKQNGERYYPYYRCANGKREHARLVYVNEKDILRQLGQALDAIWFPEPIATQVMDALREELIREGEMSAMRHKDIQGELERLREREDRVVDDLYDERIPCKVAERQFARIAEERMRLQSAQVHTGKDPRRRFS